MDQDQEELPIEQVHSGWPMQTERASSIETRDAFAPLEKRTNKAMLGQEVIRFTLHLFTLSPILTNLTLLILIKPQINQRCATRLILKMVRESTVSGSFVFMCVVFMCVCCECMFSAPNDISHFNTTHYPIYTIPTHTSHHADLIEMRHYGTARVEQIVSDDSLWKESALEISK